MFTFIEKFIINFKFYFAQNFGKLTKEMRARIQDHDRLLEIKLPRLLLHIMYINDISELETAKQLSYHFYIIIKAHYIILFILHSTQRSVHKSGGTRNERFCIGPITYSYIYYHNIVFELKITLKLCSLYRMLAISLR